jgi:hypothetical protein
MTRRRKIITGIGVVLIVMYWSSAWWLPRLASAFGWHPDTGNRLQEFPFVTRWLEIYHWPHLFAMRSLGPILQPSDTFFPPGWVLVLTQVIPMVAMAAIWWLIVTLVSRRSTTWAAST